MIANKNKYEITQESDDIDLTIFECEADSMQQAWDKFKDTLKIEEVYNE